MKYSQIMISKKINYVNVIAIIPARGGSKGIPGKNIKNFEGKPLISHSIEYAQDSGFKVLIITNGLLLNKEKNINNLLKLKPRVKISLQVLEGDSLMDARGLNMELQRYLSTILNFCNQVKNTDLDVTIDIGCNFNNKNFFTIWVLFALYTGI